MQQLLGLAVSRKGSWRRDQKLQPVSEGISLDQASKTDMPYQFKNMRKLEKYLETLGECWAPQKNSTFDSLSDAWP